MAASINVALLGRQAEVRARGRSGPGPPSGSAGSSRSWPACSTARLEAVLGPGRVVVRSMPNTPSLVGCGVAAISGGSVATAADLDWAEGILGSVGGTVARGSRAPSDAVTGVSGSGPAYTYLVAEGDRRRGGAGLTRAVSRRLVVGTMLGSARIMAETDDDPGELGH